MPDNVLFEGGAGERIRRSLMTYCDLHTILRLPAGIWYSPSVKANVLFFDKASTGAPATRDLWIYDLRSDQKFSLRENPIQSSDLEDFVRTYCAEDRRRRKETERFRCFSYDDVITRDKANLDISWKSLNSVVSSGAPEEILRDILNDLGQAMDEFSQLAGLLKG